jgi:hypothetical protein
VQQIVKGLQRLLNKRGARLVVDGGLGKTTVDAMTPFTGPMWKQKSWSQIYQDVMDGRPWAGWRRIGRGMTGPSGRPIAYKSHDGMGGIYEELGAVSDVVPSWCSQAHPMTGCTPTAGLAKPMNPGTLELFKKLQRMLNAILAKRGLRTIDVDGRIGSATVLGMAAISTNPTLIATGGPDQIAAQSVALDGALQRQMISEGATLIPPDPPTSRPSVVKTDGTVAHPPQGFSISPTMLAITAVGIGAVIALGGKKKGKRSRR